MTDPKRLIDGKTNDFERLLLGAAALEQPSRWQRHRMRRAIWLTRFGIFGTAVHALGNVAPHGVGTFLLATSLLASASSAIEPNQVQHSNFAPSAELVLTAQATSIDRPLALTMPTDMKRSGNELSTETADTAASNNANIAKQTRPSYPIKSSAGTRRASELRDEIALLDQARAALRQGQPARTVAAIDQYRTSFPRGAFDQEASVLRMEALQSTGNRSRAAVEANAFLARYPNSPHAERVKHVLSAGSADRTH